jgi:hypothetical protein
MGGPGYGYGGPPPPYGYGYGGGWRGGYGMSMRPPWPVETKPFFLTSEFWGTLLLIVGLAIAAATNDDIDSRLFWTLATVATVLYVISRGIAKSGTKSQSWDPREDLMNRARERSERND